MPFKYKTGSGTKGTFGHFKLRRWGDLNKRTVNGSSKSKYAFRYNYRKNKTELRITRNEFFEWCDRNRDVYESIKRSGETPSIDRIDSTGHYELSNMRLISLRENSRRGRVERWENERDRNSKLKPSSLGEFLLQARSRANLTLRGLECKSGIHNPQLSLYEKGKVCPSLMTLKRLASALDFDMNEALQFIMREHHVE